MASNTAETPRSKSSQSSHEDKAPLPPPPSLPPPPLPNRTQDPISNSYESDPAGPAQTKRATAVGLVLVGLAIVFAMAVAGTETDVEGESAAVPETSLAPTVPETIPAPSTSLAEIQPEPPPAVPEPTLDGVGPVPSPLDGFPVPANAIEVSPLSVEQLPGGGSEAEVLYELPQPISRTDLVSWYRRIQPPGSTFGAYPWCEDASAGDTGMTVHVWARPGTTEVLGFVIYSGTDSPTRLNVFREESGPC